MKSQQTVVEFCFSGSRSSCSTSRRSKVGGDSFKISDTVVGPGGFCIVSKKN
jgi:hypothetical protein